MSEEHARRVRSQGWDAHRAYWQEITNARPIPPARLQVPARAPVAVRARIVWERDGLELIDSTASYWTARDVLVDIRDPRWRYLAVWLAAPDVTRLTSTPSSS